MSFGSTEKYVTEKGPHWRAVWRLKGQKHSKGGFKKEAEAKKYLVAVAARIKGGSKQSLEWLIDEFFEEKEKLIEAGALEQATYDNWESQARLYVKTDDLAHDAVGDITTGDCEKFLIRLIGKCSRGQAKKVRSTLSMILKWGVRREHLFHNPMREAKFPGSDRAVVNVDLSFDEVDTDNIIIPAPEHAAKIIAAADQMNDRGRAGVMMRLLFQGGMRPSEMLGFPTKMMRHLPDGRTQLKIVQRSEHRTGTIGALKNKGSRRMITLGKSATLKIKEYILATGIKDGLLFPTRTGRAILWRNFSEDIWALTLAGAGCADMVEVERTWPGPRLADGRRPNIRKKVILAKPHYTPHQGRHFAISALIASGAQPKAVQAFAGHATLAMTMDTYGHLFPDQTRDHALADALDDIFAVG